MGYALWSVWLTVTLSVIRYGWRDWDTHRLDDDYDWRVYALTASIFTVALATLAGLLLWLT